MKLRVAALPEIETVLEWAAAEGWNPGRDDAAAFQVADPEGFFVAEREGTPIAAISVVNHDADHAFLGLYICRPDARGQGVGYALWQHALDHAGARTVGLDGVAAQQANYAKSGFVRSGATQRFTGQLTSRSGSDIRDVAPEDIPHLIALDTGASGLSRAAFLGAWLQPTASRRSVVLSDRSGFATIRQCREGAKIGPIIAPTAQEALGLAEAAVGILAPAQVSIDLPEANHALRETLLARGFSMGFETARMYRGPKPRDDHRIQAIATMELG
ncbi:GNAT family N-acetyltransferase [Thioclava pacifica]|uniref:N-acetyltransferase domain-containing protein n=1 Tax=Thioclava pacifica DSM 10166 TaxID=1353537 RepID=A0A074J2P8_9RHOB|nr:GNAT family N-acetyltransferase [Thioclava pacifica]KEO50794.1 hypothetical protein TP2_14295 [Thioclava pacifica DSM 10166]